MPSFVKVSIIIALLNLGSQPLWATYSIVATDSDTRQVGGAVTSCVAGASVARVFRSVPGVGVVHAQAQVNELGRDRAAELLRQGYSPVDALQAITRYDFDHSIDSRQYGIVNFDAVIGFTGSLNSAYAGGRDGQVGSFRYGVQGNFLSSDQVLFQAESAFRQQGCDLAEKLMLALEAGAENGEGDARCRPLAPSDAAFLQVDRADGSTYVRLEIHGSSEPLNQLRKQFQEWRQSHPCR